MSGTLLSWGAGDPVFPVADARRLAEILPNSTLRVFDLVGHLPPEERGEEVTAAMLEFLWEDEGRRCLTPFVVGRSSFVRQRIGDRLATRSDRGKAG